MFMHEITLDRYAAQCAEQPIRFGTAGSYGVEKLRVMRKGEWVDYDIIVAFHPPKGESVQIRLESDNVVSVPAEATAVAGTGELTFAGYTDGVRQISVSRIYRVAESAGTEGIAPAEPTPDVVQQILSAATEAANKAEQAEETAQSVRDDADAGKFNGAQGPKGDTGPIGPVGPQGPKGDTGPAVALDTTLTHEGEAADAKATGDAISAIKERLDEIPKIDDTAITTTSPWSGKQIVDTLCPPIEETGNPVVCYPVAGYPLGVKAKWEPVQEGSGTPSPENIRPIKGRDSVTVERCGENLLNIKPFNKFTNKGITYEYVPDGGIHISGTALASVDSPVFPIWHLPPGKYCGMDSGAGIFASIVMQRNGKNLWLNAKGAFEILAGDVTKYLYFVANAGVTVDKTIYPYIVPGTTAPTTYKPYISQTNTLILPETVYGGEVDAVTGDGKRTWEIIDNYAGETIPREWISDRDVYSADKNPTVGAQVAYRLAEPVPFTATGAQPIPALAGANTVLTDADSVSVSGRADLIHIIRKMQEK